MYGIVRTSAPIKAIVHYPKTEEDKRELADRVARVHADMVNQTLKKLNCPSYQKEQLLDAVIEAASKERDTLPLFKYTFALNNRINLQVILFLKIIRNIIQFIRK